MKKAKDGDTVKVHYTGKLEDGTIFDSSLEREPLQFVLGQGHVISGFEQAVMGMKLNEKKTVTVPTEEAYGHHKPERVHLVSVEDFPSDEPPEIGQHFQINLTDGGRMTATVVEISDTDITLDANHPLAGQDLIFDIELVEII